MKATNHTPPTPRIHPICRTPELQASWDAHVKRVSQGGFPERYTTTIRQEVSR